MTIEVAANPNANRLPAALAEFLLSHRDLFVSRYFPIDQNIPVNLFVKEWSPVAVDLFGKKL